MLRRSADICNDWDYSKEGESPELTSEPLRSQPTMLSPTSSDNDRQSAWIWHPLAQTTNHPFPSQANVHDSEYLLRRILLESGGCPDLKRYPGAQQAPRPNPWLEDPGTSAWHIRGAQTADPWGNATPANADHDPDYPAGSWNPGDREQALMQNAWDEPVFATDNIYIEDKHIDASPPYFTREALAAPRARNEYHSPSYSLTDPFAALRRSLGASTSGHRGQDRLAAQRDVQGHGLLSRRQQGSTLPLQRTHRRGAHGRIHANRNRELFRTHPGH